MSANFIRKLVFPPRCPLCDRAVDERFGSVCGWCERDITSTIEPVCAICGKPVDSFDRELCRDCTGHEHTFTQARAAFIYKGAVRESMYRFKYSNRRTLADFYASRYFDINGKWLSHIKPDVIVPIPLHVSRQRRRGYNQAALFARALGRLSGIPVREDIIFRVKKTIPQKKLSAQLRKSNLSGAFAISDEAGGFERVLLADDIYTTGSTIDEAAWLFTRRGISVYAACICTGDV